MVGMKAICCGLARQWMGCVGSNVYSHLAIFRINCDTHLRARLRWTLWRGFTEEGRPSLGVGDAVL